MLPCNPADAIIDEDISANYHQLLRKLVTPEYSTLVQEIRQFIDGFDQMITKLYSKDIIQRKVIVNAQTMSTSDTDTPFVVDDAHDRAPQPTSIIHDFPHVTLTLQKFLQYIIQDRLEHLPDWKIDIHTPSWHAMKEFMIESFIYSKCFPFISSLILVPAVIEGDVQLKEKIQCLHSFLKPEHLDLHYFTSSTNMHHEEQQQTWKDILSEPIHMIHVLDHLMAPHFILSHILKIYKSVCKVLDTIVIGDKNHNTIPSTTTTMMENTNNTESKLPSSSKTTSSIGADDIFPTLIWTIICAQPNHLTSTLTIIDSFIGSDEKLLGGEIGYAYTNFVSAVQFIRDLNLETKDDDDNSNKNSTNPMEESLVSGLSITKKELQQGMNVYKSNYCKEMKPCNVIEETDAPEVDHGILFISTQQRPIDISVKKIREARMRGVCINLEWALKQSECCFDSIENVGHEPSSYPKEKSNSIIDTFPRIYPYLHADSKDIRMSDVPLLLKEYQALVQVVESLYSERSHNLQMERRREMQIQRELLTKEALEASEIMSRITFSK